MRLTLLSISVALLVAVQPATFPGTASAAPQYQVFVEPGSGAGPVLSLIRSARHTIRLEVYMLTSRAVVDALAAARHRGVDVRVLLEQHPFGGGRYAVSGYANLQQAGVPVRWADEGAFTYTHEKAMEVDGQVAGIFTFNFTSSGFYRNREFGVIDRSRPDAGAISQIFAADWSRRPVRPADPELVVSPYSSRSDLQRLVDGARHTLYVYAEEVADTSIERHLAGAVHRGVRVRLITSQTSTGVDAIKASGVQVHLLATPYIHAKAIVADGSHVFVGSENLSSTSLDSNREMGIALANPQIASTILRTFASDWSRGQSADGTAPPPPPSTGGAFHVTVTAQPANVRRGQELTISASTVPGASCTIRVTYPDGYVSRSRALAGSRTASPAGTVMWSWRVGSTVMGTSHADVRCSLGGKSAAGGTTFQITP